MDAQQIQTIVVCAAVAVMGVMYAVLDPKLIPQGLRSFALRLGRARQPVGIGLIVLAVLLYVFRRG